MLGDLLLFWGVVIWIAFAFAFRYIFNDSQIVAIQERFNTRLWISKIFINLRQQSTQLSNTKYWVFVGIFALIAIVVRVWMFGEIPGGFNQDGAMAAVDAKALADYGTDRFGMIYPAQFTAWGYGQMSVLLSYLMVPFIHLMGLTAVSARLPILLVSLAGLVALFLVVREIWGKNPALITLAFAAINPWHIMQSRWAIDCNLFPHFFLMGLYFLLRALHAPKNLYGAMIFFALSMYSYGVAFLTVPLFLFAALLIFIWQKNTPRIHLIGATITYTIISLPVWLVMVINTLKWKTIQTPFLTMAFFPDSIRSKDILLFSTDKWNQLQTNLQSLISVVFQQNPDLPWNALDAYGTLYILSIPFAWVGFAFIIKSFFTESDQKINAGKLLVLASLFMALWAGIVIASVNVNRINIVFYFMILLSALGMYKTIQWLKVSRYLFIMVYGILFLSFSNAYFNSEYKEQIGDLFFQGFGKALQHVQELPYETIYITNYSQSPGARGVSEILTLFHHQIDAQYFQGKSNMQNGQELNPYRERYVYTNLNTQFINPHKKAVYIANNNELHYFDSKKFEIHKFNQFSAIYPRGLHTNSLAKPQRIMIDSLHERLDPTQLTGSQDHSTLGINGAIEESGQGFMVAGQSFQFGFGSHGLSSYEYPITKGMDSIFFKIGKSDKATCGDGVRFKIVANSKTIFISGIIHNGQIEEHRIALPPSQSIRLETNPLGNNHCDHANWLDPTFSYVKPIN